MTTGNFSTGNFSTGYKSTGYKSTGDFSTGDKSTGHKSTGYFSTGYKSTGNFSTGYFSTGHKSTGDKSTGDFSTGDKSTGYKSTGDFSTGYRSTGDWSITDLSTGHFCTNEEKTIKVFNVETDLIVWDNAEKPNFLYFELTKWVNEEKMSDEEKEKYPEYTIIGGYLKEYSYQDAFKKSYNDLSNEERKKQTEQLKALPNFSADIFYEISGIDINKVDKKEMTIEEIEKELGYEIKIKE